MVRLKESGGDCCKQFCVISIPYGSIKRQEDQRKHVIISSISIPYGSIKSKNLKACTLNF